MDNTLRDRLRSFIVENFLYGDTSVIFSDQDSFLRKRIIDSIGILELVSHLQDNLGILVEDQDISPSNLDSIQSLMDYIQRKSGTLAAQPHGSKTRTQVATCSDD